MESRAQRGPQGRGPSRDGDKEGGRGTVSLRPMISGVGVSCFFRLLLFHF